MKMIEVSFEGHVKVIHEKAFAFEEQKKSPQYGTRSHC
jgi:hypothetical protein